MYEIGQSWNKRRTFNLVYFFDIINCLLSASMKEHKKDTELLRINKKSILFNNKELKAIEKYCSQYRISNRSKFMREAIITSILKRFDDDYPTLF